MIAIAHDVINDPPLTAPDGQQPERFVDAGGGYEAVQMPDGRYLTCVGDKDGIFHFDATEIGPWQKCKRSGQIVIWRTPVRRVRTWAEE